MFEAGTQWLTERGLQPGVAALILRVVLILAAILVSYLSGVITRRLILRAVSRVVATSRTQ